MHFQMSSAISFNFGISLKFCRLVMGYIHDSSSPDKKILGVSKLIAYVEDKSNSTQMIRFATYNLTYKKKIWTNPN